MEKKDDLNELRYYDEEGKTCTLSDFSTSSQSASISVFFENLKEKLTENIEAVQVVVGAVAWLTDFNILHALSRCQYVGILVQKEDFIRPDLGAQANFSSRLRDAYARIRGFAEQENGLPDVTTIHGGYPIGWGDQPIRCVGHQRQRHIAAQPTMHHKFVVFCRWVRVHRDLEEILTPLSVWTGSFNFTANGSMSRENAVLITDRKIAWAYFNEWAQLNAISEPLNWESPWAAPDGIFMT
jgi:hypothetical protein